MPKKRTGNKTLKKAKVKVKKVKKVVTSTKKSLKKAQVSVKKAKKAVSKAKKKKKR